VVSGTTKSCPYILQRSNYRGYPCPHRGRAPQRNLVPGRRVSSFRFLKNFNCLGPSLGYYLNSLKILRYTHSVSLSSNLFTRTRRVFCRVPLRPPPRVMQTILRKSWSKSQYGCPSMGNGGCTANSTTLWISLASHTRNASRIQNHADTRID